MWMFRTSPKTFPHHCHRSKAHILTYILASVWGLNKIILKKNTQLYIHYNRDKDESKWVKVTEEKKRKCFVFFMFFTTLLHAQSVFFPISQTCHVWLEFHIHLFSYSEPTWKTPSSWEASSEFFRCRVVWLRSFIWTLQLSWALSISTC